VVLEDGGAAVLISYAVCLYGWVSDGFWFLSGGSDFVFRMGAVGSGFVGGWELLDLLYRVWRLLLYFWRFCVVLRCWRGD
jgi:hypothetical protein